MTERCNNCDALVKEGSTQIVQIIDYWGKQVEMPVCEWCAKPVTVEAIPTNGRFMILHIDGFMHDRKTIEAWGDTKELALKDFREKWVEAFDRDLIKVIMK